MKCFHNLGPAMLQRYMYLAAHAFLQTPVGVNSKLTTTSSHRIVFGVNIQTTSSSELDLILKSYPKTDVEGCQSQKPGLKGQKRAALMAINIKAYHGNLSLANLTIQHERSVCAPLQFEQNLHQTHHRSKTMH